MEKILYETLAVMIGLLWNQWFCSVIIVILPQLLVAVPALVQGKTKVLVGR